MKKLIFLLFIFIIACTSKQEAPLPTSPQRGGGNDAATQAAIETPQAAIEAPQVLSPGTDTIKPPLVTIIAEKPAPVVIKVPTQSRRMDFLLCYLR